MNFRKNLKDTHVGSAGGDKHDEICARMERIKSKERQLMDMHDISCIGNQYLVKQTRIYADIKLIPSQIQYTNIPSINLEYKINALPPTISNMGLLYPSYPPLAGEEKQSSTSVEQTAEDVTTGSITRQTEDGRPIIIVGEPNTPPRSPITRRDRLQGHRANASIFVSLHALRQAQAPRITERAMEITPPPSEDDEDYADMPPLEPLEGYSTINIDNMRSNSHLAERVRPELATRGHGQFANMDYNNGFQWICCMEYFIREKKCEVLIEMAENESSDYIFNDHWAKRTPFNIWLTRFPERLHSYVRWYNMNILYYEYMYDYLPQPG